MAGARITLKQSCYALEEPVSGLHYRLGGRTKTLRPGKLGTLFPTVQSAARCAADHLSGVPHELVRIDA